VRPLVVAFHDWDFEEVRLAANTIFGGKPSAVGGSVASFILV
jgi:hypothetical protein